eukprot:gene320-331_t
MNLLVGGGEGLEPNLEQFESIARDAFARADRDGSGSITYSEFVQWARSNREVMAGLEALGKLAQDAKKAIAASDDSAVDTDEGELSDVEASKEHGVVRAIRGESRSGRLKNVSGGDQFMATAQWRGQIHEPSNYHTDRNARDGPDTNLALTWAYGIRANNSRNNLYYVSSDGEEVADPSPVVVYPAATLGVIFNTVSRTQRFFQGHSAEILCLAMHPSGHIVATADVKSTIHVWDALTNTSLHHIQGVVKDGIQLLAFAPLGDRIVSVGMDPDHTVTLFDYSTGLLVSSAKGIASPANVYDIAYSGSGAEVVICGNKAVQFYRGTDSSKRALECVPGKIGSIGKRQTFFCVTYFKEDAVVGCAGGELYRFKGYQCVQVVEAYPAKEPLLCMRYNALEGTLVTGCKNGVVKTWDSTLKEIGAAFDVTEAVRGEGGEAGVLDAAITSVQMEDLKLLVGTRSGDVFEVVVASSPNVPHRYTRLCWSHFKGEVWGLAVHPTKEEFATSGDDKTVRIWSIRSHEQIAVRILSEASRAVAYSKSGDLLCLGMEDGSMALVETTKMRLVQTWTHSSQPITDVRFSPDGLFLAAGSRDTNIYIYQSEDQKSYRRQAVCRGHGGAVTHLDFSSNSRFIQSNGADDSLLFWDVRGNPVTSSVSMRDVDWASFTCTLGWPIQGIWSSDVGRPEVLTCQALSDIKVVASGDERGRVNLYRYPAALEGCLHQSYIGHAGQVTCVRFTANRRHVISLGGRDCAVLEWSHGLEVSDSSDDEGNGGGSSSSSLDGAAAATELQAVLVEVRDRSLLQEAVNHRQSTEEIALLLKAQVSSGDESAAVVRPWKTAVVEPTDWKSRMSELYDVHGATDVDLTLAWTHGYRAHDCRNSVRYTAAGDVVYFSATVGIAYSKITGKQRFLQGAHSDEILCIACHPSGRLFATGEAGRDPAVIVWDAEDMTTKAAFRGSHTRGVHLLAFSEKGDLLASIGLDQDNTLVVHDWPKKQKLFSVPTDKGKVLCTCFLILDGAEVLVTAGQKHVKFWWSQGQNVKSQKGVWAQATRKNVLSIASASPEVCLAGMGSGDLVIWKKFKAVRTVSSRSNTAIQSLWVYKKGSLDEADKIDGPAVYISGDKGGHICLWKMGSAGDSITLELLLEFNCSQLIPRPALCSVQSVCERNGYLLIGTKSSEIIEVEFAVDVMTLTAIPAAGTDHVGGGPVPLSPFIPSASSSSAGDALSMTVPGPSIPCNRLMFCHYAGEVWGLSCHPSKPIFVTAGDDCTIRCWALEATEHRLLSYASLQERCRAVDISQDGSLLAAGLGDGNVLLYQFSDFEGNLKDKSAQQVVAPPIKKLSAGSSWSQVIRFCFDGSMLAVGSHDCNIYLFYIHDGYAVRTCVGHSSFITHIDFGVLVVHVDGGVDKREVVLQSNDGAYSLYFWRSDGTRITSSTAARDVEWATFTCPLGWPVQGVWSIDEGEMGVQAVCRSHTWKDVPVIAATDDFGRVRLFNYPCVVPGSPDKSYRGHTSLVTNICFSFDDSFCISVGGGDQSVFVWATDVLEETRRRKALVKATPLVALLRPSSTVTMSKEESASLASERDVTEVLKGEHGGEPEHMIEEYDDRVTLRARPQAGDERMAVLPWKGAIREPSGWKDSPGLGEAPDADLVLKFIYGYRGWDCRNNIGFGASVSEIVYHVAAAGVVLRSENQTQVHNLEHTDDILCLAVHPSGHTVTTGEIGAQPKLLSAKGGIFGKDVKSKSTVSIGYLDSDPVSGMSDGTMLLWKGRSSTRMEQAHTSAITAMCSLPADSGTHTGAGSSGGARVITGGKDGMVMVWNNLFQKVWSFDLKTSTPSSLIPQVQAIAVKDDKLVVGTKASEIFEINTLSGEMFRLVEGHYEERGELWGLAVHPSKNHFVTAGDDCMVRIWDAKNRVPLSAVSVGQKCRAVAYSHDGIQIAVGSQNGHLKVLSADLTRERLDCQITTKAIQVLSYSPDNETLAVGAHDDKIYLLDAKTYSNRSVCRGHSSFIVHLDFSADNSKLQSACGAHELLFWDSKTGQQLKSATALRDVEWASFTSVL